MIGSGQLDGKRVAVTRAESTVFDWIIPSMATITIQFRRWNRTRETVEKGWKALVRNRKCLIGEHTVRLQ